MKGGESEYGTGGVFRRASGIYYFRFWHDGREVFRSAKTRSEKVAYRKLEEARCAAREVGLDAFARRRALTFEDLEQLVYDDQELNDHLSPRSVRSGFNALRDRFAGMRASEIDFAALQEYWRNRKTEGVKPATIRTELGYLKRAFNLAARAGRLRHVPVFPRIVVKNARKVFIAPDVYAAILAKIARHVRQAVVLYNILGWRRGEILGLTWARNVDWKRRELVLYHDQQKGFRLTGEETSEDDRHIPFDEWPSVEHAIREQRVLTDAEEKRLGRVIAHVFHHAGKPLRSFKSAWTTACAKAGYAVVVGRRSRVRADGLREPQYRSLYRIHDFRRTALRRLEVDLGVASPTAKKIIGHRTDAMKNRYGIGLQDDVAAIGAVLEEQLRLEQDERASNVVSLAEAKVPRSVNQCRTSAAARPR
jgi:integrase